MPGTLAIDEWPIVEERYFKRQRDALVDDNIYDTGDDSVPYRSSPLRFRGTTDAAASVEIYVNDSLRSTISAHATSGAFEFSIVLQRGPNKVQARKASDGSLIGNTLYLNGYTLNVWLAAYAEQFAEQRGLLDQAQQDQFIDDRTDWDGDATEISAEALRSNFGQYVSAGKLASHTREQYRDFLKAMFLAYYYAPHVRGLRELSEAYLGTLPMYRFLKNTFFARLKTGTVAPMGSDFPDGFKPRTKSGLGNYLTLEWDSIDCWMYRRWYRIEGGDMLLDTFTKYWVYVDGTEAGGNRLELKFMPITIPQIDFPLPETLTTNSTAVVAQSSIRVDTTGERTGVPNTLYIQMPRIPTRIVTMNSVNLGELKDHCEIIGGTGFISLGLQTTAAAVGPINAVVEYLSEPRILARVETQDSIISIEYAGRMRAASGADGTTNGMWVFATQSRANEAILVFPNYYLLDANAQSDFIQMLDEIWPAHKKYLIGDNIIQPSPQFPFPISMELGSTSRMRVPPLLDVSLELGATSRMASNLDTVASMVGELGASSRERTLMAMPSINEWDSAAVQISVADRQTVRGAIRPTLGYPYVLIDSRYIQVQTSISAFAVAVDEAGAAVTIDSGDIDFQSRLGSGTYCLSYFKTGDGLYAKIINNSGKVETELADIAGSDLPNASGRKGVTMAGLEALYVAYAGTPGASEELLYRRWVPLPNWAASVNLSNPGGSGTSTFGDTLADEIPGASENVGFLCVWKGATGTQEFSLYWRDLTSVWTLVYDRAVIGRAVQEPDYIHDPDSADAAYVVFVDRQTTTNSEVRFIEMTGGTWGTSVLLSATNQGAQSPSIVRDEKGNLFVTYVEYDGATSVKSVWLRVRRAGSSTWDTAVKVADSITSVLVTDTYPKSTCLPKKTETVSYSKLPVLFADKYGGGATDTAIYFRQGNRGI